MSSTSYLGKSFVVSDPDARIRVAGSLLEFERYGAGDALPPGAAVGGFKLIPTGSSVTVSKIEIAPAGSTISRIFALVTAADGSPLGWTSTRNFRGKFLNETLGEVPPKPAASKFGPNAAWKGGTYIGQRTLVSILGTDFEIEMLAIETCAPYLALVEGGRAGGVEILLTSGFRSYPEQKYLYEGWTKKLPGFNKAAKPGTSGHQNGIAFDLDVPGGAGNPTYDWLTANATNHGFVRTVSGEPWHWEYDPPKAAAARARGTFKAPGVSP